jgi:hypothetical protein
MGISVGHQFIGFLGGGVKADGSIHPLAFGKRQLLQSPVNTGTGGIHQTLHLELLG